MRKPWTVRLGCFLGERAAWRLPTARPSLQGWYVLSCEMLILKENISLDAKRAFPFRLYGRTRPGETAGSTAVPCVLLTRKGSQVQSLSRPPTRR